MTYLPSLKKAFALLVLQWMIALSVSAQIPTQNPYRSLFKSLESHWSDSVRWNSVWNIIDQTGLVSKNGTVDSVRLHKLLTKVSRSGGGVVFFPAGTYKFSFRVIIPSSVVVRGESSDVAASEASFRPRTKWVFPVSIQDGKTYQITGSAKGSTFAGVVDLDINGATIEFLPEEYYLKYTSQGRSMWPVLLHNNIIILGIRSNNAAAPTPGLPTATMKAYGVTKFAWPYSAIGNINVFVRRNCVIDNCRLNDSITANFEQPNYIDHLGKALSAKQATFQFSNHPGIVINCYKVKPIYSKGTYERYSYVFEKEFPKFNPQDEPVLALGGTREVKLNYIVKNSRNPGIAYHWDLDNGIANEGNIEIDNPNEVPLINATGTHSEWSALSPQIDSIFKVKGTFIRQDTFPFRLASPVKNDPEKKYPLIFYFHSEYLGGNDNNLQFAEILNVLCRDSIRRQFPAYIVAPQHPSNQNLTWIDNSDSTLSPVLTRFAYQAEELIDSVLASIDNVDLSRVYLMGYCAGATVVPLLMARHPGRYAAGSSLNGFEQYFRPEQVKLLSNTAIYTTTPRQLVHLSLFVKTRRGAHQLKEGGVDVHYSTLDAFSNEDMQQYFSQNSHFIHWLFSKSLKHLSN